MDIVEIIYSFASEIDIILGCFLGIIVLTGLGWKQYIPRSTASSLMVSVGIFGTFLGILVALRPLDFSPEAMNESVESLLTGMTTAFVTSVMGLFGGIITRIVWSLKSKENNPMSREHEDISGRLEDIKNAIAGEGDSSLVTQIQKLRIENSQNFDELDKEQENISGKLEDIKKIIPDSNFTIVTEIQKLRIENTQNFDELDKEQENISGKLEDIKNSIAGGGDSSLVTQIQKLRIENSQNFNKLDKEINGLANTIKGELVESLQDLIIQIREIIAKQLTKSLKELIDKIEEALIKQFGKTFVEFNQGVQAIKKWQEEHKEHVEELTSAFNQAKDGVQQISTSIKEIKESTEAIPDTVEKLSYLIRTANDQIHELDQRLKAFSDMKEKAEAAFPEIETRLKNIGDNLSQSVKGLDDMKGTIQQVTDASKAAADNIIKNCTSSIDEMLSNMRTSMEGEQLRSAKEIQQSVDDNINHIRSKVKQEIEIIAKEWGENLVAVAERCSEAIKSIDRQ